MAVAFSFPHSYGLLEIARLVRLLYFRIEKTDSLDLQRSSLHTSSSGLSLLPQHHAWQVGNSGYCMLERNLTGRHPQIDLWIIPGQGSWCWGGECCGVKFGFQYVAGQAVLNTCRLESMRPWNTVLHSVLVTPMLRVWEFSEIFHRG